MTTTYQSVEEMPRKPIDKDTDAKEVASDRTSSPIKVTNLCKSFGEQKVLNGIDLEVAIGETLSVLGQSGTGKSVLLKLIMGLQQPDSGSILIFGTEVIGIARVPMNAIRKKIGFLFQNAALYDSLTVEQNVAFPLVRHSDMSSAERKKQVRELLGTVEMENAMDKLPGQLSGGMKKRVGLARALALSPEIMLYDEPTAGLDPITALEIETLILKLHKERKMTSIVVTHDLPSAKNISDRLALMRDGKILIAGTFQDLQKSKDEFVGKFMNRGI
jgi:phospholipid/cholesterol/gamma-HCH transport system ATP-binding protein